MNKWLNNLKFNPIPTLISSNNEAIVFFTKRDLLEEKEGNTENLWELPEPLKLIKKQKEDGYWKYPGGKKEIRSQENYNQLETYRKLGILVEKYGFNKKHSSIKKATNFLFKFQTNEGNFRGIYANQYTPNYSAAIMELLIKASYENDIRIEKGFKWLLSIRQDDGGWAIPFRTTGKRLSVAIYEKDKYQTIKTDKSKPSSHLITGIVLRAFAAHSKYRKSIEAKKAGEFLKSQFFKRDKYPDRSSISYWTKFSYPFWQTNILTSLDSLSLIGFSKNDNDIKKALDWFIKNQYEHGLWTTGYKHKKDRDINLWVTLAVCRVFKCFYN